MAITFGNIKTELASLLRLDRNKAEEEFLLGQWINVIVQDIHSRNDWYWDEDREVVQTVIDKTAGTASIVSGGTDVTGASTAFAAADVGKFIQFEDSNNWYKISAYTSSTAITLETAYAGSSDLSAGTYLLRKFFYSLSSSAEKILDIRNPMRPGRVVSMHFNDFDTLLPDPASTQKAYLYVAYGVDSSGNLVITPYPFADEVYNLEVRINKRVTDLSADSDEPSIPNKFRSVIIDGAYSRGMRHAIAGVDLSKAEQMRQVYERGIDKMFSLSRQNSDHHTIIQSAERRADLGGPMLPEDFDRRFR